MNITKRKGFTLIELIGAIVIITILSSVILLVGGTARERTLKARVTSDLEALDTAKAHWTLDHPNYPADPFPSTDAERFLVIKRYLDTVQATSWTNFPPDGVSYTIGAVGVRAKSLPEY